MNLLLNALGTPNFVWHVTDCQLLNNSFQMKFIHFIDEFVLILDIIIKILKLKLQQEIGFLPRLEIILTVGIKLLKVDYRSGLPLLFSRYPVQASYLIIKFSNPLRSPKIPSLTITIVPNPLLLVQVILCRFF